MSLGESVSDISGNIIDATDVYKRQAICRKNNITISDLMAKVNRQKAEMKKEKTNENQFEKE